MARARYQASPATVPDGEPVDILTDSKGRVITTSDASSVTGDRTDVINNGATALTPKFATIAASSSGNTSVVALVASKKIRVLSYVYVCNAAVNVKFQSNTTDKTGLGYHAANGGQAVGYNPLGHFETAAGEALNINLSGAVAVGGHLTYIEV